MSAGLSFYRDPDDREYDSPTTLAVLTCGKVELPLRLRQHLRWAGETDSNKPRKPASCSCAGALHPVEQGRDGGKPRVERKVTPVASRRGGTHVC